MVAGELALAHRFMVLVAAAPLVLAIPGSAVAAPGGSPSLPERPLIDADGDRISDGLEAVAARADRADPLDVIVSFDGAVDTHAAGRAAPGLRVRRVWSITDAFAATVPAASLRALSRVPGVRRVELNGRVQATVDAANADFGTAAARADFGVDGTGIGICITDTGMHAGHEQLDGSKIAAQVSFVPGSSPDDDNGHGTHVASIAAGDGVGGSNAGAFRGAAPGASLYNAKVLDAAGSGTFQQVIDGVEWCAAQPGVDVISMSLGGGPSDGTDALSVAVNDAVAAGVLVVSAAGNSGDDSKTVETPGASSGAITVGAGAEHSAPDGSERESDGLYLAPFSSRGPTLDGRTKPDVIGPGVSIMAALDNTASDYIAYSGTSMATPFVAGAIALALQNGATAASIKPLIQATAADWGAPGQDNEFGWGFLDGHRLVAEAGGATGGTAFPQHTSITGSVANGGEWTHTFEVTDLGAPIAATMIIDGRKRCVFRFFGSCLQYEWRPDLDVELIAPNGDSILSQCALGDECGIGRQETPHMDPPVTGTYTLRVFPFSGSPNNGEGGSFRIDLSYGPVGTPGPPPDAPPIADAGPDQTVTDHDGDGSQTVTLNGTGSSDPDGGSIVSYQWSEGGSPVASGPTPAVPFSVGAHTVTLTVTDDENDTGTDTVLITVNANPPPNANAGPDQTVTDADDSGSESVTLDGTGSTDPGGGISSYTWSEAGATIASGASPSVAFSVGTHTVTLTVEDTGGATDTDTVVITVNAPSAITTVHVGDLDGSSTNQGKTWDATVTITVHDTGHDPVANATVNGSWSSGGAGSCVTGGDGTCSITRTGIRKRDSAVTFTVTGITHASLSYSLSDNHDPDGDSDGTAITVSKP